MNFIVCSDSRLCAQQLRKKPGKWEARDNGSIIMHKKVLTTGKSSALDTCLMVITTISVMMMTTATKIMKTIITWIKEER